jgi:hypothetical protein
VSGKNRCPKKCQERERAREPDAQGPTRKYRRDGPVVKNEGERALWRPGAFDILLGFPGYRVKIHKNRKKINPPGGDEKP